MLPQDPFMLYSYVNTKLRDEYPTLQAFCQAHDTTPEAITATLATAGFEYNPDKNKFW